MRGQLIIDESHKVNPSGAISWNPDLNPSTELIEVSLERLTACGFSCRLDKVSAQVLFRFNLLKSDEIRSMIESSFFWLDFKWFQPRQKSDDTPEFRLYK